MLKPRVLFSIIASMLGLALPLTLSSQAKPFEPNLAAVVTGKDTKVVNRAIASFANPYVFFSVKRF